MTEQAHGTRMRPIKDTIPISEALRLVDAVSRPIDRISRIRLEEANGRTLANDIVANQDVPPFNRAAMDGYAVVAETTTAASLDKPAHLRCIESVHTGRLPTLRISLGECTEIATGAPIPDGANAVVMVEQTHRQGSEVEIFSEVKPWQHVGQQGGDILTDQTVLRAGELLTPSRIGSIAALGIAEVDVYDQPRVAVLCTGDEIVSPGQPLAPGQIYDINRFTLSAVIAEHGGVALTFPIAGDSLETLSMAVDRVIANRTDVLVFSGGSSVGERDLTLDVLRLKGTVAFHGISVKPGKPTAFGQIGSIPVFGMPGYPTSCLSNAYLLLVPLLRRLAHLPLHQPRTISVPAAHQFRSTNKRHQFYSVRVVRGTAVGAFTSSGHITSMSQADGYIEIPEGQDVVKQGENVDVTLF